MSVAQLKFWNKRSAGTDCLITAPRMLDNYFHSAKSRRNLGALPTPVPFNPLAQNETLADVLLKKLRGTAKTKADLALLAAKVVVGVGSSRQEIKMEKLFQCFVQYRKERKEEPMGSLNANIIRPFIKVYGQMGRKVYEKKQQGCLEDSLRAVFGEILNENTQEQPEFYRLERYFTQSQLSTHPQVKQQADQLLRTLESQHQPAPRTSSQSQQHSTGQPQTRPGQPETHPGMETLVKSSKTVTRGVKFQELSDSEGEGEGESVDLCRELDLLIEDTQRILNPVITIKASYNKYDG